MALATSDLPFPFSFPERTRTYPQLRFMGSKFRLLPWIHEVVGQLEFETVLDAFSGSGCVSYLFKLMGKQVISNDFLHFAATIAEAVIENPGIRLSSEDLDLLLSYDPKHRRFIERTFSGIFFTPRDLRFLDRTWWNIRKMSSRYKRSVAVSALIRSCVKRQPRGLFTVAGDPEHYKDGRRDVQLSLEEHFLEQVSVYNNVASDNGKKNYAIRSDVFDLARPQPGGRRIDVGSFDLVYLDPPYVPRSDDNCYIKRYHFLEGLSCYWENLEILESSRVKKVKKRYTPFSYRKSAVSAFDRMFAMFSESVLLLSYSSNGFPDLGILVSLMRKHKPSVEVFKKEHRYHFGTHQAARRNEVTEYLILGQ